jgi:hypothetical protein
VGGSKRLSEQDKREGAKGKGSRTRRPLSPDNSGRKGGRKSGNADAKLSGSNVGRVLRTAYDDALREPVPDEFLNLLGKLD